MSKKCKKSDANSSSSPMAMSRSDKKHSKDAKDSKTKPASSDSKLSAVIGSANVKRWIQFRNSSKCQNNEEFVKLLLDLAEKHLIKNTSKCANKDGNHGNSDGDNEQKQKPTQKQPDVSPGKQKKEHKHKKRKSDALKQPAQNVESIPKPSIMVNISNDLLTPLQVPPVQTQQKPASQVLLIENIVKPVVKQAEINITDIKMKETSEKVDKKLKLKETEHDTRKAPELLQQDVKDIMLTSTPTVKSTSASPETLISNNSTCPSCETDHLPTEHDQCLIKHPKMFINDSITLETYQNSLNNEDDEIVESYALKSFPPGLKLDDVNQSGWEGQQGVFCTQLFDAFTQFGPLVAPTIKEVDVPEDCTMRFMFEIIKGETDRVYFNAESEDESNWIRYLRPAASREQRNMLVVHKENYLYFITTRSVTKGEELVYWQDDFSGNKKKMEKTTCGGCNMTFQHPLYYRIHCSVFHDVRYSLTIRKYHCKVCGAAVLGKENIMKHASELHNGQGAYQCQFCKKYFLRLNYLEMHRTYGCSANPHRSRPLCDFCGRKFCQPQKLKVHIKRMHSDMSEVLKEFQCKNCMKLLGSRAALQRHFKEVHQKQMDGACACSKCGKTFQNKSNLKIHMLTHSGIKPFRCNQSTCAAAFTTKQCLQFHYKKVHGYTEDMMPKIERSVDYTFEAYSGNPDDDLQEAILDSQKTDTNAITTDVTEVLTNQVKPDEELEIEETTIRLTDQSSSSASNSTPAPSPPNMESYAPNIKILTKGSKKWIGEQDVYAQDMQPNEHQTIAPSVTNIGYNRHESNASLLVEAALDSVCSEPNIDIDVATTPCAESLVNNLYTLSNVNVHDVHDNDSLADVTYSQSVDVTDSRDINLISPSVNEQISVTDDIDELRHGQSMGIDYSSFHQEDFSPPNSPRNFRDYIQSSPQAMQHNNHNHTQHNVASPPRYDFGSAVVNPESDDSNNGIGVQNLSLHADNVTNNTRDGIQLDLSIYKSHYAFDSSFLRKDTKRFEVIDVTDHDHNHKSYLIDNEDTNKFSLNGNVDNDNLDSELKDFEGMEDADVDGDVNEDGKSDKDLDLSMRSSVTVPDLRSKFELDLDLRKTYEMDGEMRRSYTDSLDDFRMKSYDLDNLDALRSNLERKTYESLIEDFRTDRNFEPLVLNPSELQGLDMSARGYHNYPNLNRYHHLYTEVDRPTVDLRLNYSPPPPPPAYTHPDILRVSLDLAQPRHSVDLSLRSQIANSRLLGLDQGRLLPGDLTVSAPRHISDMSNRILSDHTTNRLLGNDQLGAQRMLQDDRLLEQPRLLEQNRLMGNGAMSPVSYSGYSVSPSPYHPTALPPRPHVTSPTPAPYHHYSAYY